MRKGEYITGIILILIGGVFLLNNFGLIEIDFEIQWPLFLLIPGLIFELSFFIRRKDAGLLVPGGILTTYGLLFYANEIYSWDLISDLWPIFPLGVAIGLFQLYLFGGREKALLIPVGIIGGFSLFTLSFTVSFIDFNLMLGIIFILFGLLVMFRRK